VPQVLAQDLEVVRRQVVGYTYGDGLAARLWRFAADVRFLLSGGRLLVAGLMVYPK